MMRVRTFTGATVFGLALLLVAALPAAALTPPYRPDGRIRLTKLTSSEGPPIEYLTRFVGNDVYNSTADNQTSKARLMGSAFTGWRRWTFIMSIQNDGASPDRFMVHATLGDNLSAFSVKYFDGYTDITSQVKVGTFTTTSVAPGANYQVNAVVKVDFGQPNAPGAFRRLITATSKNNPTTLSDTVRLVVKLEGCGC